MTEDEVEEIRKNAKAEGWAESIKALFWCRENGSDNWADIVDYVAKNNPYKEN